MTAQMAHDLARREDDPLLAAVDGVEAAREHIAASALQDSAPEHALVGLELEFHTVRRDDPARRPSWLEIQALLAGLPELPSRSTVTVEPGGQLELSTPPTAGIAASIAALRADERVLRDAAGAAGLGLALLGADPARPSRRINPNTRYVAMEAHFDALGCGAGGRAMMASTAALQLNLDAGPADRWAERVAHLNALGPVFIAISACSPLLAGSSTGWRSRRQQSWTGIDARRAGPIAPGDPVEAWTDYALAAPVIMVADAARGERAVTSGASFADWLRGDPAFGRSPTRADLDSHLSTLFPPVRLRGYLELRYLDAVPARWWPALAAIVATLADDPAAVDEAAVHCEPAVGRWTDAARDGLTDPALRDAALGCLEVAVRRCPVELRADVEAYAELVAAGRTPGDDVADQAAVTSPLAVLEEAARD